MAREKQESSPFAALSFQEQQDRWLEWRSRQLDYQSTECEKENEYSLEKGKKEAAPPAFSQLREPPPIQLPYIRNPAPTRHHELDKLWHRHSQAAKMAGKFQHTSVIGINPGIIAAPDPNGE